jgi:predicted membrane-bound dolichyl-phosphate-mannose-protein mannosyltransferase
MPEGSLIFDEKYYVNVARIILGLSHEADVYPDAPLGLDPNHEHPFLAKGLIALFIRLLGDNPWGWRIPSVIFGMLSLFVFYLLVKRVSGRSDIAFLAAFILNFDTLFFVHGRIATLDIFVLAFMLLGFYFYFSKKYLLSAFSLTLATLCKVGGLYGFIVIIAYHFLIHFWEYKRGLRKKIDWRGLFSWLEKYALVYVAAGIILLTIMDRLWVGYSNPFDHMAFIYQYTSSLTRAVPEGIESYPWQWLLNEVKIPYLTVNVNVFSDSELVNTYPSIAFTGAMNPLIIFLAIPATIYAAYTFYEDSAPYTLFMVLWFIFTYLPFYPMSLIGHRIMYIFYFLNTVPAVSLGISHLLLDQRPPRIILLGYCVAVIASFIWMFPFKQIP